MLISAHRLSGFWFGTGLETDRDAGLAKSFLEASLNALARVNRGSGAIKGAINSEYDPESLIPSLSGHVWLRERLRWMKQRDPEFDDQPGGQNSDVGKRRNPFPAFNQTIRYGVGNESLPLDGVQVLVGHDFVVFHEFSISQEEVNSLGSIYSTLMDRFAPLPSSSDMLLSAEFQQISGLPAGTLPDGWAESEFSAAYGPGIRPRLLCGVRARARCYQGCVLEYEPAPPQPEQPGATFHLRLRAHLDAMGYLNLLATLLVNDAKVQYEHQVAGNAMVSLQRDFERRLEEARSYHDQQAHHRLQELLEVHALDRRLLDHYDQLVSTCKVNSRQFQEVAPHLLAEGSPWINETKQRLVRLDEQLQRIRGSLWDFFHVAEKQLIGFWDISRSLDEIFNHKRSAIHSPPRRNQIFISYSHKDVKWLEYLQIRLVPHITKYKTLGLKDPIIWDDTRIKAGSKWIDEIHNALSRAKIAVLLVTPNFLASDFVQQHELPTILRAEEEDGLLILWIPICASAVEETMIYPYQALYPPSTPLDSFRESNRNKICVQICKDIFAEFEHIFGVGSSAAASNQS